MSRRNKSDENNKNGEEGLSGTAMYRKIRSVGPSSWAIPIPKEYGDFINESHDGMVELYFLNGKVLITPRNERGYEEIGKYTLKQCNPQELEGKVIAGYLRALDGVDIENYIPDEDMQTLPAKIMQRLPGSSCNFIPPTTLCVRFYQPYVTPREDVATAFNLCKHYYEKNSSDMKNTSESDLSREGNSPYHHLKEEVDKISLVAKRRLAILATRPSTHAKITVRDMRDVFVYYLLIADIERLSELQDGISRHIRIISKRVDQEGRESSVFSSGKYSFCDYYSAAFKMVKEASELVLSDEENDGIPEADRREKIHNIIKTKDNLQTEKALFFRDNYIDHPDREFLITNIPTLANNDPCNIWRFNLLERSIWSMTGIAVEIAKLGQMLERPSKIVSRNK